MRRCHLIVFFLLTLQNAFSQRDSSLPWVSNGLFKDSCYTNIKTTITKLSGYKFDKHPLVWAREQMMDNLEKTDTTFDITLQRQTVFYYLKNSRLLQTVTTSTVPDKKIRRTKIYDDANNLIFWENIYENNTVMRIRRGYDDLNYLLFECIYWETPIAKLKIFPNPGEVVYYDKRVCDCDF